MNDYTPKVMNIDQLKNIAAICSDNPNATGNLEEEVASYIELCHPLDDDFYWRMWPAISQVTSTVALDEPSLRIEDYSNLSELAKGITRAVYKKAMHDCAKVFNVANADLFEAVISDCIDEDKKISCDELNDMAKNLGRFYIDSP